MENISLLSPKSHQEIEMRGPEHQSSAADSSVNSSRWSHAVAWLKKDFPVCPLHASFITTGPIFSTAGLLRASKGLAKWSALRIGLASSSIVTGVFLTAILSYKLYKAHQEKDKECDPFGNVTRGQFGLGVFSNLAGIATIFLP